MDRRFSTLLVVSCLAFLIAQPLRAQEKSSKPINGEQARRAEIDRLMNIIKKAPQFEVFQKAVRDIGELGISKEEIRHAIFLDHRLLDRDPDVRYRVARNLSFSNRPESIVSAQNLQLLLAAETDKHRLWTYAVALSEIDPQAGSALDVLEKYAFDPLVEQTFHSYLTLASHALSYQVLEKRLDPQKARAFDSTGSVKGQFVFGDPANSPSSKTPFDAESGKSFAWAFGNREPPPPPQKIPAHPLIAKQDFDKIIELIKLDSREALELFAFYHEDFPQSQVAESFVPALFEPAAYQRERRFVANELNEVDRRFGRATRLLTSVGRDGENAIQLAECVMNHAPAESLIEVLEPIDPPGPYAAEALKRVQFHEDPLVRKAVVDVLARGSQTRSLMLSSLKNALLSPNSVMRQTGRNALNSLDQACSKQTVDWLEQELLQATNASRLDAVSESLKSLDNSPDLTQKVLQRIQEEQDVEINLILLDYLSSKFGEKSDAGRQVAKVEAAMRTLRFLQLSQELHDIINKTQHAKNQADREAIEALEQLQLVE